MNCYVCGHEMAYYFSKEFDIYNLGKVDYVRCENCGFVISKTHSLMSEQDWIKLNEQFHSSYFGQLENKVDPRWITRLKAQQAVISKLVEYKILTTKGDWVDYGCGDGKLSDLLTEIGFPTLKFDRYMPGPDYLTRDDLFSRKFELVINTSVFEHVLKIEDIEEIIALVAEDGIFALHTLVREEVPKDPDWFYLLPVHIALFSNKSMQHLFTRWGFKFSIYHPESRMWFWYKKERPDLPPIIDLFNKNEQTQLFYKKGFMDYWK